MAPDSRAVPHDPGRGAGGSRGVEDRVAVAGERLGPLARRDEPLGPRTTYRVGGPAALFVEIGSDDDLARVSVAVAASGIDVLVIGRGSNLLVADRGFAGLAVRLGERFAAVDAMPPGGTDPAPEPGTSVRVRAGGAAALPVAARQTVRAGLTGFEWAVGVPGSVGGAVRMNAGGHGSEMADVLLAARLVDLRTGADRTVPATELALGYRTSAVTPDDVVVEAELELATGDAERGRRLVSEIVAWRRANQPGGQNAGSVFTNPPGDSAGRLVDAAGCKGLRRGTAEVSAKHANFIQADQGGSADDVRALMDEVRRRVRAATGVDLHPETRLAGFEGT